jgi:hypothetical protein
MPLNGKPGFFNSDDQPVISAKEVGKLPPNNDSDENLLRLVESLQSIDNTSLVAKLNETTITDNNGGRIKL